MSHSEQALSLYQHAIESQLQGMTGVMTFNLGGLSVTLDSKDIVGGAIQDWFGVWLEQEGFTYTTPSNTQMFPDFILDDNKYLEVKCFNFTAGPAFDIANYGAYINSLLLYPERLDASYLIFGYTMERAVVKIEQIWLKNIWEISGPSPTNVIELQVKRGEPVNLRPKKWYAPGMKVFTSRKAFVEALHKSAVHFQYPNTHSQLWLSNLQERYSAKMGRPL